MFKLLSLGSALLFIKKNVQQLASIALIVILYAVLSDVVDTLKMEEVTYENKWLIIFLIYAFEVIVVVAALVFVNLTYTKAGSELSPEDRGDSAGEQEEDPGHPVGVRYNTRADNIIEEARRNRHIE